ncbi:MAG TPA: tetratricopeptide repeat protein [Pirellulales bacterium]|nr:tetratricopeptide repeat protein [Pirellulales bacterium]
MRVGPAKAGAIAVSLGMALAGCRSTEPGGKGLFGWGGRGQQAQAAQNTPGTATGAARPNPPMPPPPNAAGPNAAGQGVVPAGYQHAPVVPPPPDLTPISLGPSDTAEELAGEQKSYWEKTTEKLTPKNLGKGIKKAIGRGPNEAFARKKFAEGEALFKEGKYLEAAKCYSQAADRWPDSELEEDAMFMTGESYFFADRYPKASDAYAVLLKKYDNSRHLIDVTPRQFAMARYWEQKAKIDSHWYPNLTDKTRPGIDATGHALSLYNSVRLHDPQSPTGAAATMAIANIYFRKNRFEDAGYHYDLVRKEFASQPDYQLAAHVLGVRAKLRSYQGPQYEARPLTEAEELIDQTLTQFPPHILGEERERLLQARQLVRQERAQRDFQAGEYYYKIRFYRAARFYYAEVIKEFPDTPFAQMAEQRLDETKAYRPVPRNYFAWVSKVLPESKYRHHR